MECEEDYFIVGNGKNSTSQGIRFWLQAEYIRKACYEQIFLSIVLDAIYISCREV